MDVDLALIEPAYCYCYGFVVRLGQIRQHRRASGAAGGCYIAAHYVINIFWSKPSNACGSQAQQKMCELVVGATLSPLI